MEELIKSISHGNKTFHGKMRLQAFCASLYSPDQLEALLSYLSKDAKLTTVTDKILAFRTDSEEGYDDGITIGAGEKLLHMLERMNADSIVIMIFLWDYGYVGKKGTELFKVILDSARDLLLTLHAKSFDLKKNKDQKTVTSKFFSFQDIPEVKKPLASKTLYRPGHFMNDLDLKGHDQSIEEVVVTEAELYNAVNQVEAALRVLTQSDIIELRTSSTSPLIIKVLQMVCILKGYNTSTWSNIKEMLESRTFKIELGMIDVFKITKRQSQNVRNILKSNPRLTVDYLAHVSLPASTLLSWVQGVITWHGGRNIVKVSPLEQIDVRRASQIANTTWGNHLKSKPGQIEEEADEDLPNLKKMKNSPDLEEKLRKTRELKVEYEERIERILKTRLDEVNFEGDRVQLGDEEVVKYLGTQSLQQHPTSVLLALVDKLKERRLTESNNV